MPLKTPKIPLPASRAIQVGLATLAGNRQQASAEFAQALSAGAQLVPAGAHQVYHLGLNDLLNEHGPEAATPVAWRTIVLNKDRPVAAAEAYPAPGGNWSFGHANFGPFVQATVEAMGRAERLAQVRSGEYEPRILRAPALYVMALWLYSPQRSLFSPLPPAPKELTPYHIYQQPEFFGILTALAKKVKVPPARGLAGPSSEALRVSLPTKRAFVKAATAAYTDLAAAKAEWSQRLLKPAKHPAGIGIFNAAVSTAPDQNIVGVGISEKITDGKPTGVTAVKFFVKVKFSKSQIRGTSITPLPDHINGLPVDVEQVGIFRRFAKKKKPATATKKPASTGSGQVMPDPKVRLRPAQPGCSVGFQDPGKQFVMAGTFGALVKDANGIYILSNNHVLADEDQLSAGAAIYQPGLLDNGNAATDQIAQLSRAIQLQTSAPNKVDCAVAGLLDPALANNDTLYIGAPTGTKPAQLDMVVHKFGRTTSYTVGRITSIDTDVAVNYDSGRLVFQNQVIVVGLDGSSFSDAGDSGSLIMERGTNAAVALLFAGSNTHTIANHIEDVLSALGVTLA